MSVVAASPISVVQRYWRDRAMWTTIADVFAILAAFSLPWSTSLVAIFVPCWLGAVAWVMDWRAYGRLLKQPICYLPLGLTGLAIVGTLWSDAAWDVRLHAIAPTLKLLVLPALFYHFQRSSRGMWVLVAFLVSCALLMLVSFVVAFEPSLSLKPNGDAGRGIFVKNYIDQSQEFALCAVALIYPVVALLRAKQMKQALGLAAISLGFIANMVFVIVSRTAIVTMPVMLLAFALLHLKRRTSLIIVGVMIALVGVLWFAMADLRWGPKRLVRDYQLYKTENAVTSIGLRLEFWQKSLRFASEAPLIGHGTGSLRGLFERYRQSLQKHPNIAPLLGAILQTYESLLFKPMTMLPPVIWPLTRLIWPSNVVSVKPANPALTKLPLATDWIKIPLRTPWPLENWIEPVCVTPPKADATLELLNAWTWNWFTSN